MARARDRLITVSAAKLVIVTDDHGGYTSGECLACGKSGWLCEQAHGIPYNGGKHINALRHTPKCPVGSMLDKNGKWK